MAMKWKADLDKFVGKSFKTAFDNRLNKAKAVVGEVDTDSHHYQLRDGGAYGELKKYDGSTLQKDTVKRGFNKIIVPIEYQETVTVGFKDAKIDKSGICREVGSGLGDAAAMSVYLNLLRYFGNAWGNETIGGDNKPWAAEDHPNASLGGDGLKFTADPDSGTYSNTCNYSLNGTNIRNIRASVARYVTPAGVPFLCEMDTLLVPPELEDTAAKLFGLENKITPKLNPDDNSNAANPNSDLKYLVIGGGKDGFGKKEWALCDSKLMKELFKIVYITRPRVLQSDLDNPLISNHTAYVDYAIGHGESRMIYFSRGA